MSTQQNLVGAAAIGLVVANVWTGAQRPALAAVVSGTGPTAETHTAAKQLGIELLGAGVLTLVSGSSSKAGNTGLLIVVCLWILWFIHRGPGPVGSAAGSIVGAGKRVEGNPFRTPGTVSPPVPTGPAVGTGRTPTGAGGQSYSSQIPGLPYVP